MTLQEYQDCDGCDSRVKVHKLFFPKRWGSLMICVKGSPKFSLCPKCVKKILKAERGTA